MFGHVVRVTAVSSLLPQARALLSWTVPFYCVYLMVQLQHSPSMQDKTSVDPS